MLCIAYLPCSSATFLNEIFLSLFRCPIPPQTQVWRTFKNQYLISYNLNIAYIITFLFFIKVSPMKFYNWQIYFFISHCLLTATSIGFHLHLHEVSETVFVKIFSNLCLAKPNCFLEFCTSLELKAAFGTISHSLFPKTLSSLGWWSTTLLTQCLLLSFLSWLGSPDRPLNMNDFQIIL